jgi:tetratricopeptide (TPR) repeat protein
MSHPSLALFLAVSLGAASAQSQSNTNIDGAKTAPPSASQTVADRSHSPAPPAPQAAKPELTIEMRGDIYMARKMYREAIETFRTGNPQDPVLLNKTGIAYHQLMQLDNARKSYEQALRQKKDYVEAMNNLGTVYYARKSYRRAISWYQRALKLAPNEVKSSSIYMNLGTALFARKKYEDAAKAYQTAMQLDPEVFERHGNFGVMLEERTVEERAKYHFFLAKLYAKDGRSELAIQYLRKSIEEGLKDKAKMLADPEFAGLKDIPEFQLLLTLEPRVL